MEEIIEKIKNKICQTPMVFLYFSNKTCGACEVIRKKVGQIVEAYPEVEIIDIDGEKDLMIAAQYSVFSMPLLIVFVEGKEAIRVGRYFDLLELERMIDRYYEMLYKS